VADLHQLKSVDFIMAILKKSRIIWFLAGSKVNILRIALAAASVLYQLEERLRGPSSSPGPTVR
jgi:hypothetical protein